ncbi:25883_t:CDS:2, partial [Gigaspora margarita]
IFRVRDFFTFLAMVLVIMIQTNIQVGSVPTSPSNIRGCTWSCPPCSSTACAMDCVE